MALLNLTSGMTWASQGVDASGNSKIDNAMAKKWKESKPGGSGYDSTVDQKRIVHFGSKKSGDCSLNVGTVQAGKRKPGEKAPKEIVVNTKEVINVCK